MEPPIEVATIGLDPGKDVFQVHGITADGTVVFNRSTAPHAVCRGEVELTAGFGPDSPGASLQINLSQTERHFDMRMTATRDDGQTEACPLSRITSGIIARTRMAAKRNGAPGKYQPSSSTDA